MSNYVLVYVTDTISGLAFDCMVEMDVHTTVLVSLLGTLAE